MFRPVEFFIGLRYTVSRRRNHFISFISLMSMLGIALGVTVLITVLSVMNGFEKELRDRILGVVSHVTVRQYPDGVSDWPALAKQIHTLPGVTGVAPYIHHEGMLSAGPRMAGVIVRGIVPAEEQQVSDLHQHMLSGSLEELVPGQFGIVLGSELAIRLGVTVGDRVMLISPQAQITAVGIMPRMKRFTVTGIFEIGMQQYDSSLALVHLADAARLLRLDDHVTGLRVQLSDMYDAPAIVQQLSRQLTIDYRISDWTHENVNFFRAVRMEKTVMFIILLLIVAVAAFNLVSTLVMMVTDKKTDIAVLRTMGSSPKEIMLIFMIQGGIVGMVGTLLGLVGGVVLALNVETVVPVIEQLFHIKFLSPDVYYISELPSDLRSGDVAVIGTLSLLLSLLATIYPAWRAARTRPVEALHYE